MQKKLSDVFVQSPSNEMKLDRYNRNRTIMYYSYVLACIPKHKFVDVGKGNSWRLFNIIALKTAYASGMPYWCVILSSAIRVSEDDYH